MQQKYYKMLRMTLYVTKNCFTEGASLSSLESKKKQIPESCTHYYILSGNMCCT